ncbi:MAG: PIN domain-containing protein [Faecalibacterium sp.]
MEFIDTQIISYKFNGRKNLFDGDIHGRKISSIVALEFLGLMVKSENRARMYPFVLAKNHSPLPVQVPHRTKGRELGIGCTDRMIIDFNGDFDSIIIFSNEAISRLINKKDLSTLLFFAKSSLDKFSYKQFRRKVEFLINNDIVVVPLSQESVNTMHRIYEMIKDNYNVKSNYRNSIMDLLILSTAIENEEPLITLDKELNKVLEKCCPDIEISNSPNGLARITYLNKSNKKSNENGNKGYTNNGWRVMLQKNRDITI